MRKIDIYAHVLPQRTMEAIRESVPQASRTYEWFVAHTPSLTDIDARLRVIDPFEEYQQVLTMVAPPLEPLVEAKVLTDLVRLANEEMADLVARYPDRFVAFVAALPLSDIEASLKETDRAIKHLGARGVQLFTNINGVPLDEPRFLPIFEKMAEYDLPIWVHPFRSPRMSDYPTEPRSLYFAWRIFGWPYETTVSLTRLVFAGYLKRFPNLKIIAHHAGGLLPYLGERARDHYDEVLLWEEEMQPIKQALGKHPVEYLRMVYGDTALNGSQPALACALAFLGSERLLFGSDFPFDIKLGAKVIASTIRSVEGLPIEAAAREEIFSGNAARLLKL